MMRQHPSGRVAALVTVLGVLAAACGDGTVDPAPEGGAGPGTGRTVTLVTHDSFAISDTTLEAFTAETGIRVELLQAGDAGQLVSQAVLTADDPLGDVLFGIDNTFLQRGLDAGIFEPYRSPALDRVPEAFRVDPEHRVTPVDFGDVCVNVWDDALEVDPPATLADLTDPAYRGELVVENPETSSPGLAFLLATIDEFGDDWEDFWAGLRANDVAVTNGWEEAYYGEFVAGGGDRALVVSYASSPPAEVIYADPPIDEPPTSVLTDTCYRQIEFAGILAGTDEPDAARALIDFMLSTTFQNDVPLNMFVFPVVDDAALPPEFERWARLADDPHQLDPAVVEANRDAWTARWTEIVLG